MNAAWNWWRDENGGLFACLRRVGDVALVVEVLHDGRLSLHPDYCGVAADRNIAQSSGLGPLESFARTIEADASECLADVFEHWPEGTSDDPPPATPLRLVSIGGPGVDVRAIVQSCGNLVDDLRAVVGSCDPRRAFVPSPMPKGVRPDFRDQRDKKRKERARKRKR